MQSNFYWVVCIKMFFIFLLKTKPEPLLSLLKISETNLVFDIFPKKGTYVIDIYS